MDTQTEGLEGKRKKKKQSFGTSIIGYHLEVACRDIFILMFTDGTPHAPILWELLKISACSFSSLPFCVSLICCCSEATGVSCRILICSMPECLDAPRADWHICAPGICLMPPPYSGRVSVHHFLSSLIQRLASSPECRLSRLIFTPLNTFRHFIMLK